MAPTRLSSRADLGSAFWRCLWLSPLRVCRLRTKAQAMGRTGTEAAQERARVQFRASALRQEREV